MPFKEQYKSDVGLAECPYPDQAPGRITGIYGTSTRATHQTINLEFAGTIWTEHLYPIFADRQNLSADREEFDDFLISRMLLLRQTLYNNHRGDFGISQKIINLFLKDLWAFDELPKLVELNLHAPLDQIVLGKIKSCPATWEAWTRATSTDQKTVLDYLRIQKALRRLCADTLGFHMLIEMEQFIWHRIPLSH